MRGFFWILPWLAWAAGCAPAPSPAPRAAVVELPADRLPAVADGVGAERAPLRPEGRARPPEWIRSEVAGIVFSGVSFDSRTHRLRVVDQPRGPGSQHADAASAALALGGVAGLNGGFFTPEGEPLGQVVAQGRSAGSWNGSSSLGSGWYAEEQGKAPAIVRREILGRDGAARLREGLQAGPMLVENRRAVRGLDTTRPRNRVLLVWDGGHRWWMGQAGPSSLAALAKALESARPGGFAVRAALNLDGGRSADLWVGPGVQGGPQRLRPPWHRAVRNFLVLVENPSAAGVP